MKHKRTSPPETGRRSAVTARLRTARTLQRGMVIAGLGLSLLGPAPVSAQTQMSTDRNPDKAVPSPDAPIVPPNVSVVQRAMTLLGIPYRWGGSSPTAGFDCSGLVRFVFHEALGVSLPGRADQIGKAGEKLDVNSLLPGDLVFFNTLKRSMSHVGIYLGNRKFLHAPSTGGVVRVDKLDLPYWLKRFEGGRRMVQQEDRVVTLPGALPDATHGSEVLAGAATAAGLAGNSAGLESYSSALPAATVAPTRKRQTGDAKLDADMAANAAPSADSDRNAPQRDADQLDSFIRKLTQKH